MRGRWVRQRHPMRVGGVGAHLEDVDGGRAVGVAAVLVAGGVLLVQQGHLGAAAGHVEATHGAGGAWAGQSKCGGWVSAGKLAVGCRTDDQSHASGRSGGAR